MENPVCLLISTITWNITNANIMTYKPAEFQMSHSRTNILVGNPLATLLLPRRCGKLYIIQLRVDHIHDPLGSAFFMLEGGLSFSLI